jgi:membrane-associated protease RseP (regulator of RpoE activity)
VRLTRIDGIDLNLFAFDYDLTFVVFFLDADGKVYARYGARDAQGPDERQSLEGLHYTMASVLEMHARADRSFAPRAAEGEKYARELLGMRGRGCVHCHNVREGLDYGLKRSGKWRREDAWRYPLPDNLGLVPEVDRGNVVRHVAPDSAAARAGLKPGDLVQRLNGVPIHSLADAQYALHRAPSKGAIPITWKRGAEVRTAELTLTKGWRTSDNTWRPSQQHLIPSLPVTGAELSAGEKKSLGLSREQLAFRQRSQIHSRAKAAGVQAGDVIVGLDGKTFPGMNVDQLHRYVQRTYLVGDQVQIDLLRGGKRLSLPLTLR